MAASDTSDTCPDSSEDFDLENFFPYHVRVYYRAVSQSISKIYSTRFGLSVSEWRTMAVLGPKKAMSASQIVEHSSMDKVNVSRAVKNLQAREFLSRSIDNVDRRRAVLRLTPKGREAFATLVPLVKKSEAECLKGLSKSEYSTLLSLMRKVQHNALNLEPCE